MANQPTHRAWFTEDLKDSDSDHWWKLGAMWQHKDGKGYTLELTVLPPCLKGKYRIVLREPTPKEPTAQQPVNPATPWAIPK